MPVFEYRCAACDGRFETLLPSADQASPQCPRCGETRVERLISTFAVGKSQAGTPTPGPCGSTDCACRSN